MKIKSFLRFTSYVLCALTFLPFLMGANELRGGGCSPLPAPATTVTVTPSGDGHESFTPDSPQTIVQGATQAFTLTANAGYVISYSVGGTCPTGAWTDSSYTTGAITSSCTVIFSASNANPPWYPSLNAFEHYDSGRSHLFSQASFAGDFTGNNSIDILSPATSYPSVYNMTYIDADHIYAYGGGYGDQVGSIGAFVAQVDPDTLEALWYTQLVNTSVSGEWDYPGVMGILEDGYLYVVYGYRLSKLDPATGDVITTLELPTGNALPENTSYNGFDATVNGVLVMKTLYRQAGCGVQGPEALLNCPDPSDVPASVLVSVNPQAMTVLDEITLPSTLLSKVTVGTYNHQNYAYLFGTSSWLRYSVSNAGELNLDTSWNPGALLIAGQTPGSALLVMNDWVIGQSNSTPGSEELSLIAVSQADALTQFSVQPFVGDSIPSDIENAFLFAGPGGSAAVSWMPAPVSADPEKNLIYTMDALPGEVAAYSLSSTGFNLVWKVDQRSTESIAIIGSESERIIVGTDIPSTPTQQIPGNNSNDSVVWRNAANGSEIARSDLLPQITPASMVQPYYSGDMFYPGLLGNLYKLIPASTP